MPYDKGTFAERLQESRKEKENYRTQTDFAAAFEQYLETTGEKNVKSKLPIIKKWESAASPTLPETRTLFKLCDFLDVDCDYLTGRIDSQTHDLKFISNYTGLPETTISKIQGLSETETTILSGIINHQNLKKILQTIADLTAYGQLDYDEKHAYSFAIESLTKQFDQENLIEYIYDPETGNIIDIKGEHNEYDPFQSTSTTLMENILIHAVLAAFENIVRDISDTPIS